MPCFRCGARQTDPVRGASPWKRGVRADHQVLICPACQAAHDWADTLDRCAACGSAALVCRLGEVECRDCGHTRDAVRDDLGGADLVHSGAQPPADGGLSEEVAAALSRVLKRGPAG
ncbi:MULTISPECIES: hypothetical protein [Actinomadura]|uniref:Uncharacterized protein n=1 Tax=Actinomadura madurae TaxID=1993 RepID=A0A1I4Z2J9_9ACTN|nr:hypothetical protein [Actinomadura madurae]SFN44427.1 hypothetical protein SAMN04489713_10224 [Actinomadura madurae]SPT49656.1 Uncharacterised protein [Actinomadura madurae]